MKGIIRQVAKAREFVKRCRFVNVSGLSFINDNIFNRGIC